MKKEKINESFSTWITLLTLKDKEETKSINENFYNSFNVEENINENFHLRFGIVKEKPFVFNIPEWCMTNNIKESNIIEETKDELLTITNRVKTLKRNKALKQLEENRIEEIVVPTVPEAKYTEQDLLDLKNTLTQETNKKLDELRSNMEQMQRTFQRTFQQQMNIQMQNVQNSLWGSNSGGGEVRIEKMDDFVRSSITKPNGFMHYNAEIGKFELTDIETVFPSIDGNVEVISLTQEMIDANVITIEGSILEGKEKYTDLFINGVYYVWGIDYTLQTQSELLLDVFMQDWFEPGDTVKIKYIK